MTAQGAGRIRDLLDRHGIRPQRRLGQNFLADPNIVAKIVSTADVGSGDRVVEVGAGTGTLTAVLADVGTVVVSYEIDRRLQPVLAESLAGRDVDLRFADAAKVDLSTELTGGPWTMVANLPYNVGTGIVLDTLRMVPQVTKLVVMVQKEVADRLVAGPGSRAYGLPSVVVAIHGSARIAFTVPPTVFVPRPPVTSAVVAIERTAAPPHAERAIALAAAAFAGRRKMVRRSLDGVVDDLATALATAGVDPTDRAEDLAPGDYLRLAEVAP